MSSVRPITAAQFARALRLHQTVSYPVAALAALGAAFLRYQLNPLWGTKLAFILFYPAVALAAWLGGLGPGLLATAVSAVCALFFLAPLGSLRVDDPYDLIGLSIFVSINVLITALSEAMHRAHRRAEVTRDDLWESEERLRGVVTSATDAIITIDAGQKITLFSAGAEAIFGYSADEMIGQTLDRLIPERFRELHRRHVDAFGATEVGMRAMGGERILAGLRRNEEEFPIEARISQVEIGGEKLYTVILRDITERKRAEEARRESEARLKGIISSATDSIIAIDADQKITLFNAAAEATFGYSADEMMAQPLDRLIPERFRGTHRRHIETFGLTGVSARQMGGERVLAGLKRSGEEFPMEARISQVEIGGQKLYTVILRDITERKQAEAERERTHAEAERMAQRLQRIQSIMDAAVADLPFDELLHELLRRVQRALATDTAVILLRPPEEEVLICHAAVGLEEEEERRLRVPIGRGFAGRIAAERTPLRFDEVEDAGVVNPLFHEKGVRSLLGVPLLTGERLLGVLHVGSIASRHFRDDEVELLKLVADRIALAVERAARHEAERRARAEAEAAAIRERDAREAAEAASRAKDEFLATVSHELRTPLSPILTWARMLRRGDPGPEKVARGVEAIERCARAQAQLIEDLLDVSRIIAGKLRLEVRPMMVAPVIEKAVDIVRSTADAKSVRLETVLDAAVGAVLGDAGRLQQVVWNLLSNAVRFTPEGGRVEVRLGLTDSRAEIVVNDTGQGIRPDFLPFVFERFRQADSTTTRAHGGLGLGLAIVRHIVEAHGGTVHAESRGPGQGAVFTLKLPLMTPRTAGEAERRHPIAGVAEDGRDLQRLDGLRILLVDDEPESNEAVESLVASCGAEVRAAGSAERARTILAGWSADVLVSDVAMPGEDGYALISSLRAKDGEVAQIPAVALTAYASREDKVRLLSAGFQAHVPKPLDAAELVAVIASLGRAAGKL